MGVFFTHPMRDVLEELRSIRNSEPKEPPTAGELEAIAEQTSKVDYAKRPRSAAVVSRMLPQCYTTFTFTNVNIQNLHEETLFYIFYALANTDIQVRAYNELVRKGYRFSKSLGNFVALGEPCAADGQSRTVTLFDPYEWQKVSREVVFDAEFVGSLESFTEGE